MDIQGEAHKLWNTLIPDEVFIDLPDNCKALVRTLFSVILGMYLANSLTGNQIKEPVDSLTNSTHPKEKGD